MALKSIHKIFATVAFLSILTFFSSTIIVEAFFSQELVALIKKLIVFPGLFILIPAIIITAISGKILSKKFDRNIWVDKKQKRMPIIALNGIFILIPSAIFLYYSSINFNFDTTFFVVQALELLAGFVNLFLMFLNIKDSKKIYS